MSKKHDRGQLDWLVELAGATAPSAAAAFAAQKLALANGWTVSSAVLMAGAGMFIAAFAAMRLVPAEARVLVLPEFEAPPVVEGELHDDALLLDVLHLDELLLDQPLINEAAAAVAELLLDDPLPVADPDSRVVQLFAGSRMPTAGQLKARIDRHLADGPRPAHSDTSDASDALSEALAELRRSLRQA